MNDSGTYVLLLLLWYCGTIEVISLKTWPGIDLNSARSEWPWIVGLVVAAAVVVSDRPPTWN